MSQLVTEEITLPVGGKVLKTWTSPRTGKQAWAKKITVQAKTTDVTISTDNGTSNMLVPVANVTPTSLDGVITSLYLVGTAGNKVEISAVLAV